MNIFAWILRLISPLVVRVMSALGFTAVTYIGTTALLTQLVTMAQNNWSSLPTSLLQLATLSGIPTVLGMIFGAYASLFAISSFSSASKYILKK